MNTRHPILLVEDDATLREALAETLRLADYPVVTAADGSAALEELQGGTFSAVVTDYQMPYLSGLELCAKLRSDEITAAIPAVMLTARGFSLMEVMIALTLSAIAAGIAGTALSAARRTAEVVARGYDGPASVMNGWMNSTGHRRILTDPRLEEAAFARVGSSFTGNFGTPASR